MWYASNCSGIVMTIGVSRRVVARHRPGRTSLLGSSTPAIRASPADGDGDDGAAARLGFLHVADHLLEHVIVRRDGDDRHLLVDERDRAVLHLARRIAFGVDVGDFLQLERAFERDRVVDAAAEEQEVGAVVEPLGHLLDGRRRLDRLLDDLRQLQQLLDVAADLARWRASRGPAPCTAPAAAARRAAT